MSCYQRCEQIPWYKFQQRRLCQQGCDQQTYLEQAQANIDQTEASAGMIRWIIPGLVVIAIFLIIAKAKKWI